MSTVRERWQRDFNATAEIIPAEWVLTFEDGWQGIDPEHAEEPLAKAYLRLMQCGYANGWLPIP